VLAKTVKVQEPLHPTMGSHIYALPLQAQVLAKLGQSEDSVRLLTELNRVHPSSTEPLQHLGMILATRGEFEEVGFYLYLCAYFTVTHTCATPHAHTTLHTHTHYITHTYTHTLHTLCITLHTHYTKYTQYICIAHTYTITLMNISHAIIMM